jgi:hypothetical protein
MIKNTTETKKHGNVEILIIEYVLTIVICAVMFLLDLALFPMTFYSPSFNETATLIGVYLFAVCTRAMLPMLVYCMLANSTIEKAIAVSLLNAPPAMFTEGVLMYSAGMIDYCDIEGLSPKFVDGSVITKTVFAVANLLSNYLGELIFVYAVVLGIMLELPRFLLGVYLMKRWR